VSQRGIFFILFFFSNRLLPK